MPLHRDIHWLGRQWAVTGHGLQLINQKQMGYYDIEAARLWDARVVEVQTKAWIDRADFDKALEIARGKFAQLAPADLPPSVAVTAAPPSMRPPPAAPRVPPDATSVSSIEELLARLKSKSAAPVPVAKPAEAPALGPLKVEPSKPVSLKAEPLTAALGRPESMGSELPKSELPKVPKPEIQQTAPVTPDLPRRDAGRVEPPKVESARAEPAEPVTAKPEAPKAEPLRSEALKSEVRKTASVKPAPPAPTPAVVVVRNLPPPARAKPAWPVFERKIAGSGRFVRPWRVASPRWRGPGLPPRP